MEKLGLSSFRDKIIEYWDQKGLSYFDEVILSSALNRSDLQLVKALLIENNYTTVDVSLVIPSSNKSTRTTWVRYYDEAGQCIVINHEIPIPEKSNNLKLTFAYSSPQERQEKLAQISVVINLIRLVFGVPAAREHLFTSQYSADDKNGLLFSETGFASIFDTQNINRFENPALAESIISQLPQEAAFFLDKAFAQVFPHERFVLMWLAFETIINSMHRSTKNGNNRQRFYKDELGSDVANQEVYRLFKFRCDIFKEGKIHSSEIENKCWSLYAAIQLSIMDDCPQRAAYLKGYEAAIKEKQTQRLLQS